MTARPAVITAVAVLLGATSVGAQDHRVALTGYVGSAAYSNMAADAAAGVLLAPGAFTGAQAELLFGRFGLRLNGGYASPSLDGDPDTGFSLVTADLDLIARLRRPYRGLFFQPYAVLGAGAVRYDLGTDASTVGGESYATDPATRASLVLGLGTDLGRGPVAVRFELMDIIGIASPLSRADGSRYGPVQHVVLTFGLGFRTGSIGLNPPPEPEPRPIAIAPAPRPRPRTPPRTTPSRPRPRPPVATPAPPGTPPPSSQPSAPRPTPDVVRPEPPSSQPNRPKPSPNVVEPAPAQSQPSGPKPKPDVVKPEPAPEPTPEPAPTPEPTPAPVPDPADSARVHGRLFTVRVTWNATDAGEALRAERMNEALTEAGLPFLPADSAQPASAVHQRLGAWRNAAHANAFGEFIAATYGLPWEWIHIERDEPISAAVVAASTAFVDALSSSAKADNEKGKADDRKGHRKPGSP